MTVVRERVLVVGGSSGVGSEVVDHFRWRGDDVTVVDCRPLPRRAGGDAGYALVPCDLTDPLSICEAVAELDGPWDAVIVVAGIAGSAPDELVVAANFLGVRDFVTTMTPRIRPGGSLVVVASTEAAAWADRLDALDGLLSTPGFAEGCAWYSSHRDGYPASMLAKEATVAFLKRFSAQAWREHGVRVNSVSPEADATPVFGDIEDSIDRDVVSSALGRAATSTDIASVITFLASIDSKWVVGQDIQVDGGLSAASSAAGADDAGRIIRRA